MGDSPQGVHLLPGPTALDNVALPLQIAGQTRSREHIAACAERLQTGPAGARQWMRQQYAQPGGHVQRHMSFIERNWTCCGVVR